MPYYLLLVGSPEEIPFEFQYQLDAQYAVGRIHFDTPEEYHRYALHVVDREARACLPKAAFFAVRTPGDRVTDLMVDHLSKPLAHNLTSEHRRWKIETILGREATKKRLQRLLVDPEAPSLLFTACHGLSFSPEHADQREAQGALICADWPGRDLAGPPQKKHYLSGSDLPNKGCYGARVVFNFSCHGAGTPKWDDFSNIPETESVETESSETRRLASHSFVARLPQRLLAGGVLAVIGHVERAWDWSFRWSNTSPQIQTFESVLWCLLSGDPVGTAFEYLGDRFAELSIALDGALQSMARGEAGAELEVARLFVARNDARNYILLGDPAVRLAIAERGVAP